jgi:hypothetical protein
MPRLGRRRTELISSCQRSRCSDKIVYAAARSADDRERSAAYFAMHRAGAGPFRNPRNFPRPLVTTPVHAPIEHAWSSAWLIESSLP